MMNKAIKLPQIIKDSPDNKKQIEDDLEINRNTFPLKFVLLCFLYLILSISISNKLDILRPIINSKIKNNFNFKENIFPFNKFETGENNTYLNIKVINYNKNRLYF